MKRGFKSLGGSLAQAPTRFLQLPFTPSELSEEELMQVAGAAGHPTHQPTLHEVINANGGRETQSDQGNDWRS